MLLPAAGAPFGPLQKEARSNCKQKDRAPLNIRQSTREDSSPKESKTCTQPVPLPAGEAPSPRHPHPDLSSCSKVTLQLRLPAARSAVGFPSESDTAADQHCIIRISMDFLVRSFCSP